MLDLWWSPGKNMNVTPKIAGCCTDCEKLVFDVIARGEDGRPKQLGAPQPDARRVTFLLADGSVMDLTFCSDCISSLNTSEYGKLWDTVLVSWLTELGDSRPPWFMEQMENTIMYELGVQDWVAVMKHAH